MLVNTEDLAEFTATGLFIGAPIAVILGMVAMMGLSLIHFFE